MRVGESGYGAVCRFGPASGADHAQHTVGRIGRPEDVSWLVRRLCTAGSGFVTGQNFFVDGGMTKKMLYAG